MMEDKGYYFKFRFTYAWAFENLRSDADRGKLLMAMVGYYIHGVLPEFSDTEETVSAFFKMIRNQLDEDMDSLMRLRETNSKNAQKRWSKMGSKPDNTADAPLESDATAYDRMQSDANECNLNIDLNATYTQTDINTNTSVRVPNNKQRHYDPEILKRHIEKVLAEQTDLNIKANTAYEIINYFTEQYKNKMGSPHPYISTENLKKILAGLPDTPNGEYLDADEYKTIIKLYFEQNFNKGNCDYSIYHFMSGQIREMLCRKAM